MLYHVVSPDILKKYEFLNSPCLNANFAFVEEDKTEKKELRTCLLFCDILFSVGS